MKRGAVEVGEEGIKSQTAIMGKINTAERVSREMSDNFVFQRSAGLPCRGAAHRRRRIGDRHGGGLRYRGGWHPMHGVHHGGQIRPGSGAYAASACRIPPGRSAAAGIRGQQFRFRDLVPGDRACEAGHRVGARSETGTETGRQVHRDDPQCTDVAHPQPVARTGIYGRTTPQSCSGHEFR